VDRGGSHDEIEKLIFFNFIMATQAYFSFYNAVDTFIAVKNRYYKLTIALSMLDCYIS